MTGRLGSRRGRCMYPVPVAAAGAGAARRCRVPACANSQPTPPDATALSRRDFFHSTLRPPPASRRAAPSARGTPCSLPHAPRQCQGTLGYGPAQAARALERVRVRVPRAQRLPRGLSHSRPRGDVGREWQQSLHIQAAGPGCVQDPPAHGPGEKGARGGRRDVEARWFVRQPNRPCSRLLTAHPQDSSLPWPGATALFA